jgi:CheY-like chemotaxis protein
MSVQILVVDDESVTCRVVTHALKAVGIEVLSAGDSTQAIAMAEVNHFALAIVDINLPDIDGFELMRRLKQLPNMADIPMIAFTARNQPGDKHTANEVGAVGFLYKPFSTQELRAMVMEHLPQT